MQERELNSWEEFLEASKPCIEAETRPQPLLFRGQANSEWGLQTTLERRGHGLYSASVYYQQIGIVSRTLETVTGRHWELPELTTREDCSSTPTGYAYMAFLRQNGFPSPLLDWSRSPYVASFFAYHDAKAVQAGGKVAIYAFQEYGEQGKQIDMRGPAILGLGRWIATDRKHFLQQSEYTICRRMRGNDLLYCPHEDAMKTPVEDYFFRQDLLTKFILPAKEAPRVRARLYQMNITEYSLFEDTRALLSIFADDVLGPK